MNLKKKAFAFSFIALFLSFVIFAFASITLFNSDFNKDDNLKTTRVMKLNEENIYFQEVFLNDALKFSLYHSLEAIVEEAYLDISFQNSFNNNITQLNTYFFELLTNSSLNGNNIILMDNKNIYNLTTPYLESFEDIHRASLDFNVVSLRVFEKNPFYLNFEILASINLTSFDNVGSWNNTKIIEVAVPTITLKDPIYALNIYPRLSNSLIPNISPNTYFQGNIAWDFDVLNETIENTYSTVFFEPLTKYTIGNSYLSSLLNFSLSSYLNVTGFWSFDYDLEESKIYDTSQNNQNGTLFGLSKLLLSFDEETMSAGSILDLTSYENQVSFSNIILRNTSCIYRDCIELDSTSLIEIENISLEGNSISFSFWFNVDSTSSEPYLFKLGTVGTDNEISIRLNPSDQIEFTLGRHVGSSIPITFTSISNISRNTWNHLVVSYNGNTGIGKIFINGEIRNGRFGQDSSSRIDSFLDVYNLINIGSNSGSNRFIGLIDEIGVFSKEISNVEVAQLYSSKKIFFLEYIDSLHGKGIFFNGINNYVEIENSQNQFQFGTGEFSYCVWFKPILNGSNFDEQILISKKNNVNQGFSFGIVNSSRKVFYTLNNIREESFSDFQFEKWYFSCITRDSSGTVRFYLNGILENEIPFSNSIQSTSNNLFFARESFSDSNYFGGIIDEIKFFNRTLSKEEIVLNYYSFDTFAKGCCNIISLVNTNKLGFNTSSFNLNVSISSKLFIETYFGGRPLENNILINLENITSNQTNDIYYNAFFDICLLETYNLADYYEELAEDMFFDLSQPNTGFNCETLILNGIY